MGAVKVGFMARAAENVTDVPEKTIAIDPNLRADCPDTTRFIPTLASKSYNDTRPDYDHFHYLKKNRPEVFRKIFVFLYNIIRPTCSSGFC